MEAITRIYWLAEQLAAALRSFPCRCELTPWRKGADGVARREVARQCSRCAALAAYDGA